MLVYGTANPEGYSSETYQGVYLTDKDISDMVPRMLGVDVKVEHHGATVGRVVSAWEHMRGMDLLVELDEKILEGSFAREFVRRGMCKDFSLGYKVEMSQNAAGKIVASGKKVVEVSIVRKGARDKCHIKGWNV